MACPKTRPARRNGNRILSKPWAVLISLALVGTLLGPCLSDGHRQSAFAAEGQTTLSKQREITYSGWNTHVFSAKDGEGSTTAYCVEPSKDSPRAGVYNKSDLHCPSNRDGELRAHLWFAFGAPGFDPQMWPSANWKGEAMSDDDYYVASHVLLSDTFLSDANKAGFGADAGFKNWVATNITGLDPNNGSEINPHAVGRLAAGRSGEVPGDFSVFQINSGVTQTIVGFSPYTPHGLIKIQKHSSNPDVTSGNPNYSMKGIRYGVYTDVSCEAQYDLGITLELDESGYAEADCPFAGTFCVREIEPSVANTGYAYNPKPMYCFVEPGAERWVTDWSVPVGDEGGPVQDDPVTYDVDVLVQKHDMLTQSPVPSGEAMLANAQFEVRFFSNAQGSAEGQPTRTWTFMTDQDGKIDLRNNATGSFVTGDDLFRDPVSHDVVFPLGTYAISEITAPASYELPLDQAPRIVTLTARGTGVHDVATGAFEPTGIVVDERPVRHDFSFIKRDMDTQRPMARIPFLISRVAEDGTVLERHVIVTDANGMFSSSADHVLHTTATNRNDAALIVDPSGSYAVNEELIEPEAGVWFGTAQDGGWIEPRNDFGAFPDGVTTKYIFDELPVQANEGKALVHFAAYAHAAQPSTLDFGTIGNPSPTLSTIARDGHDGDKLVSNEAQSWIQDAVSYTGLVADQSYLLRGTLMDAASVTPILDAQGNPYVSETFFTAQSSSGNLAMDFFFDASSLANGDKVVVYESLYEGERLLKAHDDWLDGSQTVTIVEPAIQTQASDGVDGDSIIVGDLDACIRDHVTYSCLTVGDEYTLTGTVMDAATGLPFDDGNGVVTASVTFVPSHSAGELNVSFAFDATGLPAGKRLVVFERLAKDDALVAAHEDLEAACQTVAVYPPALRTQATDPIDGNSIIAADLATQIVDTVSYDGLTPGQEYTLRAALVDKETGYPVLDAFEQPVVATHVFTPFERSGQTDVPIEFDASQIKASRAAVVFEDLYRGDALVARHQDLNSVDQSILIEPVFISTFASAEGGLKSLMRDEQVSLHDEVSFRNLKPGATYQLIGTLVDKQTEAPLLDERHQSVETSLEFAPDATNGLVAVDFTFDATDLNAGDELVVYERLLKDGVLIAAHEDLADAHQTVTIAIPQISTLATSSSGSKELLRGREARVFDEVSYQNLTPGCEYQIDGALMDPVTGNALRDASGTAVTARTSFIPEADNGSVTLEFAFDASQLEYGQAIVAFETLTRNDRVIAMHADLEDANQTVSIVAAPLETFASDPADGDKVVAAHDQARILDMVSYDALEPDEEYRIVGTLMGVETREPLLTAQGNPARTSLTFTPRTQHGTLDMVFTFDASDRAQQQDVVVFQELYHDDVLISDHSDPSNRLQTVTIAPIKIETFACDASDGDKELSSESPATITDSVSYFGLTPGRSYELRGKLMIDNGTLEGAPLLDALGKGIEAHLAFTPDATQGTVNLDFELDASTLTDGTSVVAFEELFCEQTSVAAHQDLQDENQTVRVASTPSSNPDEPVGSLPEFLSPLAAPLSLGGAIDTGDAGRMMLAICGVGCLGACAIILLLRKRIFKDAGDR